ncbi:MAG: 7TM receptor with intracellular metal dependent [Prolixibacteraceae bacterium]|nr:MAG: 7TM receptor with intracellular metal dependent [Prolixibacteraceae bacterium]
MNDFQKEINNYALILYWVFVFGLTAVLLYLILPGEPKFKYEYQKGFPWPHENLVAPFDFAILKSDAEFQSEKTELLKSVVPYFQYDTSLLRKNISKLTSDFELSEDNPAKTKIYYTIKKNLTEIYETGILQRSVESYEELTGKTEIKKRTWANVTTTAAVQLYSEKSAYNKLNDIINELKKLSNENRKWLRNISPEKYITANLEFDKATTDKEIAELTANISQTRGMVQVGERIILQGEIVDQPSFQILESLKASYQKGSSLGMKSYMSSLGRIFFILAMLSLVFSFIYIYRHDILNQHRKLAFLLMFMVGIIAVSYLINQFPGLHIYLVPLAVFPIIVRTFFDSRTAIFMLFVITLIIGFYAPNNYEYILVQFSAGVVAVFSLNKMHRRVYLVKSMLLVMFTYWFVYSALNLIFEGSILNFNYNMMKWFAMSSLFILLVYPMVYIFEKLFGFISDVTLIELSDSNQPLLRKLAEVAPGTFQHSLLIASLAEEVILKIGGNPFLVRAGALYHDIGKISKPNFFIENQAIGMNPHDDLNYIKSAELVIDHVKNGVIMARKYKLPDPIVEFIATHHGTTKANYFYLKQKQENPDKVTDQEVFNYPGPLPKSKEATVVMLIDGIEAASRSLKEKTSGNFKELINKMIDDKIKSNQLDNSLLTFSDVNIIKEILLNKLINIYHVRIEYPKE